MNFIYNEADAMLIDGDGVYFLETRADNTELETGESEADSSSRAPM